MKNLLITIICGCIALGINANVNTMRKGLKHSTATRTQEVAEIDDTIVAGNFMKMRPGAITMKGFAKRASDSKESFFLTNHTDMRIGMVQLLLRYTDIKGDVLHERTVKIPCDIPAQGTRQVSIASFDKAHTFYYFREKKSRKQAMPFKVTMKVLRYDIVVSAE